MAATQADATTSKTRPVIDAVMMRPTSNRNLPEYEPSHHRNPVRPTTYCETLAHMLKASIGTGILAMPHAFSKAGYRVGIIGTILIGFLCTYCMRTIVNVQYELCRRLMKPSMTFMETASASITQGPMCCRNFKYMAVISNVMILTFQLGCSCIYMIFVSRNTQQVFEYYTNINLNLIFYMAMTLCLLCFTALISNLKFLAILSFVANIATLMSFSILAVYIFRGNLSFENRVSVGHYTDLPLFIGTVVFSLEAIGAVIPLENKMKDPLQFTNAFGVLHVAMVPTVTLYVVVGLFGYLNYGDDIQGAITLNLPNDEVLANMCKLLMVFGIFSTMVLALFIMYEIIWKSYVVRDEEEFRFGQVTEWICQYLLRLWLVIVVFLLSIIVPNLELLISLVGSLCLASAGIAFPALFNLYTYWEDYEGCPAAWFITWCVFIIFLGMIACVIGVATSLQEIYETIWSKLF